MKRSILIRLILYPAILCVVLIAFHHRRYIYAIASADTYTVSERLSQFGDNVEQRLTPFFDEAGIKYPPQKITLIAIKAEKKLELWAGTKDDASQYVRSYPIKAASGTLGPKLREGDGQVPEGLYNVNFLHANSAFHLALRLNYPNEFDKAKAAADGRERPGSDIMIHGSRVSIGCLAMGDEAAEDLFVLGALLGIRNISVIITPVDFRDGKDAPDVKNAPTWLPDLYAKIRNSLKEYKHDDGISDQ